MRVLGTVLVLLVLLILPGCGGGGGTAQIGVSQQTLREVGEQIGPCVATVDDLLDLLAGFLHGACAGDPPPDVRDGGDGRRVAGRDDPRDPPDTAPSACSAPSFDPRADATTWQVTLSGDPARGGLELLLTARLELGGVPITVFDPRNPPQSVAELFENVPNNAILYLDWTVSGGGGSGSLTAVFQDGAATAVSGSGLFDGPCDLEFTFDDLDPRAPYPSAEISIAVEVDGETVTVTVSLGGTPIAACTITTGSGVADCTFDLGTGGLSAAR